MKTFKQPVATEDRIVRATLPYWWPAAIIATLIFLYIILF